MFCCPILGASWPDSVHGQGPQQDDVCAHQCGKTWDGGWRIGQSSDQRVRAPPTSINCMSKIVGKANHFCKTWYITIEPPQPKPRLMKDWVLVGVNLKTVFQSLAELKADMTINEDDTSEKLPRLHPKLENPSHRYSEFGVLSDLQFHF